MSYEPRQMWRVVCNDCGAAFTDPDADDDTEVLLFHPDDGSKALAAWMRSEGWSTVGGDRHLCPPCSTAAAERAMERLAIECTHEPLPVDEGWPT